MKRGWILLMLCLGWTSVYGVDLSFSTLLNYDLSGDDSFNLNSKRLTNMAYVGFMVDVPVSETSGVFFENSVRFEDVPVSKAVGIYNKNIHWDGNILGSWHPFNYHGNLDPYLVFGFGCSGAVFFDERSLDWRTKTQLVIFPEVGAGLNLNIRGLLLGGKLRTQILSFNPSPLTTYEQFPVALTLSCGVRID